MSTSPRVWARPSIDSAITGVTIPGNKVTMSMRMRRVLQLQQAVRRPDDDAARRHVDLEHDLRDRRDQVLARAIAHDPQVLGRGLLDAGYSPDLAPVVAQHATA